jgi:hypothetical protein
MRFGGAYVLWQDPRYLDVRGNELSKVLSLKRRRSCCFGPHGSGQCAICRS